MKIRIEIDCDNAAFEHAPQHETARILTWLAKELRVHGIKLLNGGHKMRDINGNTVGKAEIIEPPEEPVSFREFLAQARASSPFQPEDQ